MPDVSRRDALKLAAGAGGVLVAGGLAGAGLAGGGRDGDVSLEPPEREPPREYDDYTVRRVPGEFDTVQAAVDATEPRDLVLVGPGVYRETAEVTTPRVTVRGTDRNAVVIDGEFRRANGVVATADHVVVENLTARHCTANGVYWDGVVGYRGSHLSAYNNGDYGIYAFGSVRGRFDDSYASGHPDSGFYIGQCRPCHAVVENVVAEGNAIGYSGTNAGGRLVVRNSRWRDNMAGIVPNTLDHEYLVPQRGTRIEGNEVRANNNEDAPAKAIGFPAFGTGIAVAGGMDNLVVGNDVADHANFGVAVFPMIDDNLYRPAGNEVRGNVVRGSGRADLALGAPAGGGNVFRDNDAETARPVGLDGRALGAAGRAVGDPWVTLVVGKAFLQTELGSFPGGDWRRAPEPPDQPGMADPERPPREAVGPEVDG